MGGRLIVLSGASGAGKTSVARRLLEDGRFQRAVTATTRPPRGEEREGVDYHFVDPDDFRARWRAGGYLAPAQVYGHLYGTPRENVERILDSGRHCLLVVDVQGVEDLRRREIEALYVFVDAPSFAELERRLRSRGDDAATTIKARLEAARAELRTKERFDRILVNDDIERAARELAGWVGIEDLRSEGSA